MQVRYSGRRNRWLNWPVLKEGLDGRLANALVNRMIAAWYMRELTFAI